MESAHRGTVLRKKDFESPGFVAPSALTLFKKDLEDTVLCTIKMDGTKQGLSRHLSEVSAVDLGEAESAEYVGAVSGYKESFKKTI